MAEKSVAIDLKGKHSECVTPDFGPTVGGFVKHVIAHNTDALHPTRTWCSPWVGVALFGVMIVQNPCWMFRPVRTFANPSRGGYISQTIAKLPKQF